MNTAVLILYWILYTIIGIIIQKHIPGVDALAPGFLIALQSGRKKTIFWIFLLFILIQEGAGSMQFGSSLLWYGGLIPIYFIVSHLVVASPLFSTIILSGIFSAYGALVKIFICAIQDISVDYQPLLETSLIQAIIIPIIWIMAKALRKRMILNVSD